ncbi:hypothetical protein V8E36_002092 [Tilletia maclaganii]
MEDSLDEVSRHCSQELMNYQRCLIVHQTKDVTAPNPACDQAKRALSNCAATAVPALARLRELCAPKIRAYDACLSAHAHLSDEQFTAKCGPTLLELYRCTQGVRNEVAHGGPASQAQAGQQAFLGRQHEGISGQQ